MGDRRAKTIAAVAGITALAVVGMDAGTYAGTGDSLILGKFNKAGRTTHVTSTGKGPALSLHARGNQPDLAVDSNAKVVRLNADRVDGMDAAGLQNNARVATATSGSSTSGVMRFRLPDAPNGRYQVDYSVYMGNSAGSVTNPVAALCFIDNGPIGSAYASTTSTAYNVGLSGSDIVARKAGPLVLICEAYQEGVGALDWEVTSAYPVRVTLTRVDKTIRGQLPVTRSVPHADRLTSP